MKMKKNFNNLFIVAYENFTNYFESVTEVKVTDFVERADSDETPGCVEITDCVEKK